VRLAARMCERGHIRLVGTVSDASRAAGLTGVTVVDLNLDILPQLKQGDS
jgi:hypothetical protein